jgi:DNA-binding GntR family transcriptional regulator
MTDASEEPRKRRSPNTAPVVASHRVGAPGRVSDLVYRDLRQAIVGMELVPGAPVLEGELTARYGVSRTPVREAVLRLADGRLVDVVAKSGTFVSRIPLVALREGIVARRALEGVTVAIAAEKASESEIMSLRALIQRQKERADAGDDGGFHQADDDFHAAIAAAARYPGLWSIIRQIRVQVERYRRLTLPQPGRMHMVVAEHGRVVDAIDAREPDGAVRAMHEHLDKLQIDIAVFRDLWPDYFIIDGSIEDLAEA